MSWRHNDCCVVVNWICSAPSVVFRSMCFNDQLGFCRAHVGCNEARISEDEPVRCGKLQIEFDETSQMQRLRFGIMATEAVFSVLATWTKRSSPARPLYGHNMSCTLFIYDSMINDISIYINIIISSYMVWRVCPLMSKLMSMWPTLRARMFLPRQDSENHIDCLREWLSAVTLQWDMGGWEHYSIQNTWYYQAWFWS